MESENPKIIRGKFGGEQLVYRGFRYAKSKQRENVINWECCERSCRARFNTDKEGVPQTVPNHNHQVNNLDIG